MANTHLVTGYAGQVHVTAADQGAFHVALFGSGQYVLGKGNRLAASVISSNLIRVSDGDIYMQGRHIRIEEGTTVDLAIENGAQGVKRNDLIVARYTRNTATAVEEVNLVVIKGTAVASNPVDPAYTTGDIIEEHAVQNDMPLYRVPIDGLTVGSLVPLFTVFNKTIPEINETVNANKAAATTALNEHTGNKYNPHNVTAEQVGTYTSEQIEAKLGYNRAETLSSLSKSIFGLGDSAVPNDVFNFLGKYNQHWWRTRSESGQWTITKGDIANVEIMYLGQSDLSIQCADSVELNSSNQLQLVNPTTVTIPDGSARTYIPKLYGKYYILNSKFYYNPPGYSMNENRTWEGDAYRTGYNLPSQLVQSYYATSGEIKYVYSTNRNAYPDSGTVSGVTYWYLGIPFDNAVKAPKCASGTYVGSGTYGSGSPNKIQLDFTPRFVIILKSDIDLSSSAYPLSSMMFWVEGQTKYGTNTFSVSGNVISWYASSAAVQLNVSGTKYCYYVCG